MDPRDRAIEHRRQNHAWLDYNRMDAARTTKMYEERRAREAEAYGRAARAARANPTSSVTSSTQGEDGLLSLLVSGALLAGGLWLGHRFKQRLAVEETLARIFAALGEGEVARLNASDRAAMRAAFLGSTDARLVSHSHSTQISGSTATVTVVGRCTPRDGNPITATRVWKLGRGTDGDWQLRTLPTPFLSAI